MPPRSADDFREPPDLIRQELHQGQVVVGEDGCARRVHHQNPHTPHLPEAAVREIGTRVHALTSSGGLIRPSCATVWYRRALWQPALFSV
ncbi:MAG TPA: hypothetical protein VFT66_20645 [Roseiflexaceae bacterium]|nr:hypothetical protein [Roseiflexaceae bacterium]